MGIHLLYCTHGGEKITSHDVVQNIFAYIVINARFHVLREQTHILPLSSHQSFHRQIDIVLSIDGNRTLANVVITNPTQGNFVSWATFPHGVTWLLPSKCLFPSCHKGLWVFSLKVDNFFHWCANMAWTTKDIRSPPLLVLRFFYRQKMLVALQRT